MALYGNGAPLLTHVMEDNCADPDCELHNLNVAMEEEVVSFADVAWWLAGVMWMWRHYNCVHPDGPKKEAFDLVTKHL